MTSILTLGDLFTLEMLSRALDLLADVAGPLVADVTEEQGRREINRITRAVGGAISRLDERRREYVAALKAQPRAIDDLFRTTFRQPAEALKERIRAPLSAWEEDIRAADEETNRLIGLLNTPIAHGTTAAAIQQRLDAARELELPDWLTGTQRGEIVAAMERNTPGWKPPWRPPSAPRSRPRSWRGCGRWRGRLNCWPRARPPRRRPRAPHKPNKPSVRRRSGRKPPPPRGPPLWRRWPSSGRQRQYPRPPGPLRQRSRPPRHPSARIAP